MEAKRFVQKRIEESLAIFTKFNGDWQLYNLSKRGNERMKRKRQNEISHEQVMYQMELHDAWFPKWFNVVDGTDRYLGSNISQDVENLGPFDLTFRSFEIPVRCREDSDMCSILKTLFTTSFTMDMLHVALCYDNTTIDVPQKMVLMRHEDSGELIPESLKHQTRYQSPQVIGNVIGANFDNPKRPILITPYRTMHTRYLHRDWSQFQLHRSVPNRDVPLRVCYGIHPHTVSVIVVVVGEIKIVLFRAIERDAWQIEKDSVIGAIEAILHFG